LTPVNNLHRRPFHARHVQRRYPISRFGYSALAGIQAIALVLFVFFNWAENQAASAGDWLLWSSAGGAAFAIWGAAWLCAILLAGGHCLHVRAHGDQDARREITRMLNGFIFFPPFAAVVGYVPVYILLGLIAGVFS
jgi:hypothetical protein